MLRHVLLCFLMGQGLHISALAGPPALKIPSLLSVHARPTVVDEPGEFYRRGFQELQHIRHRVQEYGRPVLRVAVDRVTVRHFAWRGGMEGVRVDPFHFSPTSMRRFHPALRVKLEGLFCDEVGEDAVSIAPRSIVDLTSSTFAGNFGRKKATGDRPGQDKLVQIDGADVVISHCDFFYAARAVRAKANSHVTIQNCRFIKCKTCVSGDGMANPRRSDPYDNGQPGTCRITLIDCEAWDCDVLALAHRQCIITLIRCSTHDTKLAKEDGGKIIKK